MAKARSQTQVEEGEGEEENTSAKKWRRTKSLKNRRELGLACVLNTEIGAILAVIRRAPETPGSHFLPGTEEVSNSNLIDSLKSLRALIFNTQQKEWRTINPSTYISPFLEVIQSDDIPAPATGVALSALLKILKFEIFDKRTPGAREAIHSVVMGLTNCRLEKTDSLSEDTVLMRILQLLLALMKNPSSVLLTDHAVCTVVNTCFQVVQQSASRGDLLHRNARHTMHELIQVIYARLPEVEASEGGCSESDTEDGDLAGDSGYGARCMVDIFQFLCSLLNVVEVVDAEGMTTTNTDEDVQLFALILINSAIELGGEEVENHPKLLRMIQDDLFHHLIHYGSFASPLVSSMICSIVLNLYHFLRRHLRCQLEAFFTYVLLKVAASRSSSLLQEVAVEGIINFCRQPNFIIEIYVNYDCDPVCKNVLEDTGKLLCKNAFPLSSPLSSVQVQAFEGLITIIHNIADHIDTGSAGISEYKPVQLSEYKPFWFEKCEKADDLDTWVEFTRIRKLQKKRIMIAANHFNKDEKKGMDFLKHSHLVPNPPEPKSLAYFYRHTPGLDKSKIGDYLGDPDEFNIQVLKEFTEAFDFSGVILDTALRTYLETFRLPGEAQKIQRILEAFSDRFFEQQSSDVFVSKDAVFILCYSLIMLNTDLHNPQVKKKMTEEEFIRNNRAINGGKDLPREYLSELFQSILTNAITIFGQAGAVVDMNPNRWADLIKRSKGLEPFMLCNFEPRISREMFIAISGPSIAALSAIFERADNDEILQDCIEGLISVARIARHGLSEILDELLACLCKFTTLLNPYASAEETLFAFSNDLKPRMATLAAFTIANKFGKSIKGAWRNIVDCLLKLKRLKLLPQSVIEPDPNTASTSDLQAKPQTDSGVIFPSFHPGLGSNNQNSSIMGRFSQFLSLETTEDPVAHAGNDFEQNLKIIQQCRIGNIFNESCHLPDESLQNLGRALIFAAAGKGQKFSTPVEEEETVGFCWELLTTISVTNIHRFQIIWPSFHDYLVVVAQFPLFSPCPFSEKAILSLFKICLKILSTSLLDKHSEELIFKSINMIWKLDKEVLDTCSENITQSISRILTEFHNQIQTTLGWKMLLHFLTITARHPEIFDEGVEALISLLSHDDKLNKINYPYCIDCAFGFAALKISPLETSIRILDLMADSVNLLVQWYQTGHTDPGSSISVMSNSSNEDWSKGNTTNFSLTMFTRVAETFRKTSLVRREELRNHSVASLRRIFELAEELGLTSSTCMHCFNNVFFAMVDDLHEKMVEYSRRPNSEREMKSMEGTLMLATDLLVEVFLQFLMPLSQTSGFRQFWLGLLRRMDTFMKVNLGEAYETRLQEMVPELLKKMLTEMKEKEVLVQKDGDELWDITNIQIQWIAPSVKDELFPEEF